MKAPPSAPNLSIITSQIPVAIRVSIYIEVEGWVTKLFNSITTPP